MLVNDKGRERFNVSAYGLVDPKLEPLDLVKVPEDVPPLLLDF